MTKAIFEFHDFSGGEYGLLDAWRAPKNSFTGTNMLVYRTGELGVRPGFRDVTPSGMPGGAVLQTFEAPDSGNGLTEAGFAIGTTAYHFQPVPGGGVNAYGGSFTSSPSGSLASDPSGNDTYIVTTNSGAYRFVSGTLTALTGSPNGQAIAKYGDRIVMVPSTGGTTNTLRYSDAANPNSWPAGNTITVGDTDEIRAIMTQRTFLTILKNRDGIWSLTGVPGVNDTLRQIVRSMKVDFPKLVARDFNENLWFFRSDGESPVKYDGARSREYEHLNLIDATPRGVATFSTYGADSVLFMNGIPINGPTTSDFLLFQNGAWTKHVLAAGVALNTKKIIPTNQRVLVDPARGALSSNLRQRTSFTFLNLAGTGFYAFTPDLDRPGSETTRTADFYLYGAERAGDGSAAQVSGSVTFPEQHTTNGEDLHVRGVIIDFRKWNTGGSLTNHFDLTVNALRTYETAGTQASATQSFDEAGASASTAGTLQRKYFSFGDQAAGGGFQLAFTNVRGVAFQRITVVAEQTPARV